MSATTVPTRITIDFRTSVHPSRMWILGIDGGRDARIELLASEPPRTPRLVSDASPRPHVGPTALTMDCACPDFCERDHANE